MRARQCYGDGFWLGLPRDHQNRVSVTTSAADIVWEHWRDGRRMAALPEAVRPRTRADGYAVQAALAAHSTQSLFD
jgi:hypothetical protein